MYLKIVGQKAWARKKAAYCKEISFLNK